MSILIVRGRAWRVEAGALRRDLALAPGPFMATLIRDGAVLASARSKGAGVCDIAVPPGAPLGTCDLVLVGRSGMRRVAVEIVHPDDRRAHRREHWEGPAD